MGGCVWFSAPRELLTSMTVVRLAVGASRLLRTASVVVLISCAAVVFFT